MKIELFTAFKKRFESIAVSGFFILVLSMAGCIAASKSNMVFLSGVLAFLFVSGAFFLFFHLRYLIHNVTCPKCQEKCISVDNTKDKRWLATCEQCDITWQLGVGAKSDASML